MGDEQELETDIVSESDDSLGLEASADSESSLTAKEAERLRIQAEIEAFLAQGGRITTVDSAVMTDPPKRPDSNYGGQPI